MDVSRRPLPSNPYPNTREFRGCPSLLTSVRDSAEKIKLYCTRDVLLQCEAVLSTGIGCPLRFISMGVLLFDWTVGCALRTGHSPPTRPGPGPYDRGRPERGPRQVSQVTFLWAACLFIFFSFLRSLVVPQRSQGLLSRSAYKGYCPAALTRDVFTRRLPRFECFRHLWLGLLSFVPTHGLTADRGRHTQGRAPPHPRNDARHPSHTTRALSSQVQRDGAVHPRAAGATHPGGPADGRFRSPERDGGVVRLPGEPVARHFPLRAASDQLVSSATSQLRVRLPTPRDA